MKKSALLKVLVVGIASIAIAGSTMPAFAQHAGHIGGFHGGGFHGGGFHGGGFHGGGFHGGGFHGGSGFPGGFHASGHGGFHSGVGFPSAVHASHWHGGYWGYPRYGYGWGGWGFGISFGIGIGWGWPYPYYGYGPWYYPPYYYPAYPYPYHPYYPVSRPYAYSADNSDRISDGGSSAVQGYARGATSNHAVEHDVADPRLQQLPPERRRVVQNVARALRAMPADARQRQIDNGSFRNLSPQEQALLNVPARRAAVRLQSAASVPRPPRQFVLAQRLVRPRPPSSKTATGPYTN